MYGAPIERSCTGVMGAYFAPFDPKANTDEFYAAWQREYEKGNQQHKYYSIIRDTLAAGGSHDDAAKAIRASWEAKGAEAARLGTLLHLHCEYDLNGEVRMLSNFDSVFRTKFGLDCGHPVLVAAPPQALTDCSSCPASGPRSQPRDLKRDCTV